MPCQPPKTNTDKNWPYDELYHGDRDECRRKNGNGLHHWTGAESLQWYEGCLLRDTMHGNGDYRWRYLDSNHKAVTYEGHYYNNRMHGYGVMSYADGRVFNGLYYNNVRWGPGVESHACLREDVGLWYGTQLVRLTWRPAAPSVAIDLASSPVGRSMVDPHRLLLVANTKSIGEVNSALELLKQCGSEPLAAAEKWPRLYPKYCTDTNSQLCHVDLFDRAYYNNQINTLVDHTGPIKLGSNQGSKDNVTENTIYYAWNNNRMIMHMMKHCYQHEEQRAGSRLKLEQILSGKRSSFKPAGKHELDCRTLLMASYLGDIPNVAQLVNEFDVNPNVTDIQGNSVIMYAACGDQPDIIHFLLEAGGEIDGYNDACCTPLGVTLLRFALARWEVAPGSMLQALLPPSQGHPSPHSTEPAVLEWKINRDITPPPTVTVLQKAPSKVMKPIVAKKTNSVIPALNVKKKSDVIKSEVIEPNFEAYDQVSAGNPLYNNINKDYLTKVREEFTSVGHPPAIPNIFDVRDMSKEVDVGLTTLEDEHKKPTEIKPKKVSSKSLKDNLRPSREMMWQAFDLENDLIDSKAQMKQDKLGRIMLTILQLLNDGADPRKVRCPQPSLFIATVAGCADLIRRLVRHGADVNEVYPKAFGYSSLDVAVSGPLTSDNLEVVRALLECGAKADHRIPVPERITSGSLEPSLPCEDGPTLLHAALARKIDFEPEDEVRRNILELLLKHGCNPITQYKGHSAVEIAMLKHMDIFDIFIKSPNTDLNAIINDQNQTILVKMFHLPYCKSIPLPEKIQTLTNLLLFGADPLLKCQNEQEEFSNLFVYARKILAELEAVRKPPSPTGNLKKAKSEMKTKKIKDIKSIKSLGASSKGQPKPGVDDLADYRQALDLVVDCARLLYIRWLQAKLMKELIEIVDRYKHRHWNMILKEHKNKKSVGLWLTALRCLEIWDVLKITKKKVYNDRVLKYVLCIVHYYHKRMWKVLRGLHYKKYPNTMSAQEKALIESEVSTFMQEYKLATMLTPEVVPAIRQYVTPELTVKGTEKFNVCFECVLPLADAKIPCGSCKLIAFCSFDCMKINIGRNNCHPCSEYLRNKYFPSVDVTETDVEVV